MMKTHKHSIRNLDRNLILDARIYALQSGETLGELINRCLEAYLFETEESEEWESAA